ncbi:histidinol phosphatase [Flavobacterium sp. F-380]|uniref:protein-tyrosine-phosphatase n=1 Tax=Flavobacterium kayseriense TaxID=2764714 RepID=A0ABR7J7R7_9FLAO|nr:CpsB/CapC family capsule biosynthesis tyrosine phosphatase [Flavobacterium kayseriense]MBC5841448.1 histidinol phosphatase [Flavobacterium kayseriense]MBC5847976.1 histidinol phosphatase [Flavobacterium kayseriense]
MLFFSKNKSVLKDLIPDNHVDIHSHLLPGIDDGARTFADSLRLTKALQSFGVTQIITTPHIIQHVWDNSQEDIEALSTITKSNLETENILIPFKAAAEYLMDDQFVRLFQSKNLLTLKDNYVLVEMSYINAPIQLYTILFDLQVAGYTPILAHPERYLFYQNNFDEYKKLKRAGCLFQLNLLSVVGYYGAQINKTAEKLLSQGLYDYVGSDVHHDNHIAAFSQKVSIKDTLPLKEIISNNQFFKE